MSSPAPSAPDPIASALHEVYHLLTRGVLTYLVEAAPTRSGQEDRQTRIAEAIQQILEREAELAEELAAFAETQGEYLRPGTHSLGHTAYHFLELGAWVRAATVEGNQEADRIQELKLQNARHPQLSPLLAKVLSTRREHLRRLARLESQ